MKKIKLTESELTRLITKVIKEQHELPDITLESKVDTMMKQLDDMHSYMKRMSKGWKDKL